MNLPEKAHDTCVAQIAEALFGQPGMSLMEMANRRAEIPNVHHFNLVRQELVSVLEWATSEKKALRRQEIDHISEVLKIAAMKEQAE